MLLKCFLIIVIRTQLSIFNKNLHIKLLARYSNEHKFDILFEDLIRSIFPLMCNLTDYFQFADPWFSLYILSILISMWRSWSCDRNYLVAHTQNVSESLIPAFFCNQPSRFLIVDYVDSRNYY